MSTKALRRVSLSVAILSGCAPAQPPAATPPAAPPTQAAEAAATKNEHEPLPQVRFTGAQRTDFPNGDSALVLNYETDIPISDMPKLRHEAESIWAKFRIEVENAGLNTGVLRATHNENTGFITKGSGYGFVYTRDANGSWRLQDDTASPKKVDSSISNRPTTKISTENPTPPPESSL